MENGREGNGKTDRGGRRERHGRWTAALLPGILTMALCAGCGAVKGGSSGSSFDQRNNSMAMTADSYDAGAGAYDAEAGIYEGQEIKEEAPAEVSPAETESAGLTENRKLIRNVDLEVETREFERLMSSLEEQTQELGGYIENMETYNGSSYSDSVSSRFANLTIRVPSGKLDTFLQTVSEISNVVRRTNHVEDVTLSYVDMESRRNTLRTEQERLLTLLKQAETVEDIIAIEERLSEVRYQLESMESKLRTIDNLVDYSTVRIYVSEVRELTPVEESGVWERIAQGFVRSIKDIGKSSVEFAVWFLSNIPYLVIWAAALAGAVLVGRKFVGKRLRKRGKKGQEPGQQKAQEGTDQEA